MGWQQNERARILLVLLVVFQAFLLLYGAMIAYILIQNRLKSRTTVTLVQSEAGKLDLRTRFAKMTGCDWVEIFRE